MFTLLGNPRVVGVTVVLHILITGYEVITNVSCL